MICYHFLSVSFIITSNNLNYLFHFLIVLHFFPENTYHFSPDMQNNFITQFFIPLRCERLTRDIRLKYLSTALKIYCDRSKDRCGETSAREGRSPNFAVLLYRSVQIIICRHLARLCVLLRC